MHSTFNALKRRQFFIFAKSLEKNHGDSPYPHTLYRKSGKKTSVNMIDYSHRTTDPDEPVLLIIPS